MTEPTPTTRRSALRTGLHLAAAGVGAVFGAFAGFKALRGLLGSRPPKSVVREVWQIDPYKCTQCGNCATYCVLNPSAVKCVHAFQICGYCDICSGYYAADRLEESTAAESQLCPVDAITRRHTGEEPYYEYTIDEALCIGCGKCVKGCAAFGNGSLYMQVRHDRCVNCNECAIAVACPAGAFVRVSVDKPYILKTFHGPERVG